MKLTILLHNYNDYRNFTTYCALLITWLREYFNGVHDIHTVTLSWDDQPQVLERFGIDNEGIAPGS